MRCEEIFPKGLRRWEALHYGSQFSTTSREPGTVVGSIQKAERRDYQQSDIAELWIKPYLKLVFFELLICVCQNLD